jgi:hypothetical protein
MASLTFEQWLTLLVTIGGAFGAIWTFLAKTYFPARQRLRELEATEAAKQREHEREVQKDRLEHEQDQESRRHNYDTLQASWREDKIAELLEKDSSFIREDAREGLDKIKSDTSLLPSLRDDIKFIKLEQGNLRGDFRLLLGIVQEIYEGYKEVKQGKVGD